MKLAANWTKVLGLLVVGAALAGSPPPAAAQKQNATFKVVCVADRKAADITGRRACLTHTPKLSFGDELTLAVEHAPEVTFDDSGEPNPADLVLFLEGKALPGTRASVGKSQLDTDGVTTTLLTYRITRDLSSQTGRANWKEVLVAAQNRPELSVSTGLENGTPAVSSALLTLDVMPQDKLILWWLLAAVGGVIFFLIALKTNALRDAEPDVVEGTADKANPKGRAYSLARVQMALWTVLILYAYMFVWVLTGEYKGTIPASAVGLMGISLATFGTAAAIDAAKAKENQAKLKQFEEEHEAKLKELDKKITEQHEKKPELGPGDKKLLTEYNLLKDRAKVCPNEIFYEDISTSEKGVSLHRLQFILWTLALAVVFVVTVWKTLAMPDFDATLLGLMGLTSGAYAGLKLPEAKT